MSYYGHRDPLEFFFAEEFDESQRVVQVALADPAAIHLLVFNMISVAIDRDAGTVMVHGLSADDELRTVRLEYFVAEMSRRSS